MTGLSVQQARRRYLIMTGLRWLPTGMLIPVLTLLPLSRGLTLSQLGLAAAVQGVVVLALELPTGGLSDSLGRRPVLLLSTVLGLASLCVIFVADSFAMFALAFAIQGVYRALDSGPLQAWFVDSAHAAESDADIAGGLSGGGAVLGITIACGSLIGGGLIAWDPVPGVDALAVPVLAAAAAQVAGLVVMWRLLVEVRDARGWRATTASLAAVPRVVRSSFGLLRGSRVLQALISVELFWGFGMVAFEILMPIRLTDVVGSADDAAALMGPAAAGAWAASAGGAAIAALAARRVGVARTAAAARIVQGVTVVGMALLAGPVGVVAAYLATYAVHGASVPMHETLLHRHVTREHRTTVLSMNSMVSQPAGAIGLVVLTSVADGTSASVAMIVGAIALALAAPLYLPARRAERRHLISRQALRPASAPALPPRHR